MILIVNVCKERLHYYEFVKPIVDVLDKESPMEDDPAGPEVLVSHYEDLTSEDLGRCDKVIICGTSLSDNKFLKDVNKFFWLKDFDKPVLGICAGFQILGIIFGGELKRNLEIGFSREEFKSDFLGLKGETEVYHLHNNYVDFGEDWKVFSGEGFAQAVKWNNFYGVLFHPEVRNKEMILRFCEL